MNSSQVRLSPCFICDHENIYPLNCHFYEYHLCQNCTHIASAADENGCKKMYQKYKSRFFENKNFKLQNSFTQEYVEYELAIAEEKKKALQEYKAKGSLLDVNCGAGKASKILTDINYTGIEEDKDFELYFDDKTVIQSSLGPFKQSNFDNIFLYKYLCHSFCPFDKILRCFGLLKSKGRIFIIEDVNNDPKKNYLGKSHEFSTRSIEIFAKQCSSDAIVSIQDKSATVVIQKN